MIDEKELVESYLSDFKSKTGKLLNISVCSDYEIDSENMNYMQVVKMVCDATGWTYNSIFLAGEDLGGKRIGLRNKEKVYRRSVIDKIARENGIKLVDCGRATGRDHTTIIHSVTTLNNVLETEPEFKKAFKEIFLFVRDNWYLYKGKEYTIDDCNES
jgi:hypothetical protein